MRYPDVHRPGCSVGEDLRGDTVFGPFINIETNGCGSCSRFGMTGCSKRTRDDLVPFSRANLGTGDRDGSTGIDVGQKEVRLSAIPDGLDVRDRGGDGSVVRLPVSAHGLASQSTVLRLLVPE